MNSKRSDIVTAIIDAALAAALAVDPRARAWRARVTPIDRSAHPAIVARPVDDRPVVARAGNEQQRVLGVAVTVIAWGDTGAAIDATTDPIAVAVHQALLADQSLGGLSISITDNGAEWAYEDVDGRLAGELTTIYRIAYRTPLGALT